MDIAFYISFVAIIGMGILVLSIKEKNQMHYAFIANISCMVLWGLGLALDNIAITHYNYSNIIFTYIAHVGATFFPVALWYMGMVFKNEDFNLSRKYLWILAIPIISNIVLWTNEYHHLFYKDISALENANSAYGLYFYFVHAPFTYLLIFLWLKDMTTYALRNGGILLKQVILLVVGTATFLFVNILFTLTVLSSAYWNIIAFAFMLLCYLIAMLKYNFLNIIPIAKERIMDSITEGFIVLDKESKILDINKPFIETFENILPIKVGDNFIDILKSYKFLKITPEYFKDTLEKSIKDAPVLPLEVHIKKDKLNKWFNIIVSCINKNRDIGSIITFRDITYEKQHETISLERTKLRGFVQISGDLAHDINSPLSVVANSIDEIAEAFEKYANNKEDFLTKYEFLRSISKSANESCKRTVKIANKLRWQTTCIFNEERKEFALDSLLTEIGWEPEISPLLKQLNCKISILGDKGVKLLGYPENLSRVLKNIVKNAVESYMEKDIEDKVVEISVTEEEDTVTVAIKDFGIGISEDLQNDILKKPLKTKNLKADGGGVSLFFAPLIVTGQLEGKIWFKSKENIGSTFFISIPLVCSEREQEKLM